MTAKLSLCVLPEELAVCRLAPDSEIPVWALSKDVFSSITRTSEELSIVCRYADVTAEVKSEGPWRAIKVNGPLDFALTGILSSLTTPLAEAGISIFAISTFDTDYLLLKSNTLDAAVEVLREFCNLT